MFIPRHVLTVCPQILSSDIIAQAQEVLRRVATPPAVRASPAAPLSATAAAAAALAAAASSSGSSGSSGAGHSAAGLSPSTSAALEVVGQTLLSLGDGGAAAAPDAEPRKIVPKALFT
jgi:hypothetical protein